MTDDAPPWSHMLGRMAAVGCRTARGALRYRDPDHVDGDGESANGAYRFWFAAPGRWRVEDEDGVFHVQDDRWVHVRDTTGRMQRMPRATSSWGFSFGHPWTLFGTERDGVDRFTRPDDFSVPTGPGMAATVAGRTAWEYVLAPPPHKPHPLHVTVDDATGTVLRLAVPGSGVYVEMTEFDPDVEIGGDVFTWQGEISTGWMDENAARARAQRWMEGQQLPVPRWWPGGVGYMAHQGDPGTGAFSVYLEVSGGASLARWPLDGQPPGNWDSRTEDGHVHEWSDGTWHWALAVPVPLSADELERVVSSIPAS